MTDIVDTAKDAPEDVSAPWYEEPNDNDNDDDKSGGSPRAPEVDGSAARDEMTGILLQRLAAQRVHS